MTRVVPGNGVAPSMCVSSVGWSLSMTSVSQVRSLLVLQASDCSRYNSSAFVLSVSPTAGISSTAGLSSTAGISSIHRRAAGATWPS